MLSALTSEDSMSAMSVTTDDSCNGDRPSFNFHSGTSTTEFDLDFASLSILTF